MGFCESRTWDIRILPASGSGRDNLRKPFRPKTTAGTPEPSPERGFFLPFSCFCLASSPSGSILHIAGTLFNPIVMLFFEAKNSFKSKQNQEFTKKLCLKSILKPLAELSLRFYDILFPLFSVT